MNKKLKPCQGCGRELDPSAKSCPGCGRPDPTKPPLTAKNIVTGILAVTVLVIVIASMGGSPSHTSAVSVATAKPEEPPVEVTAMDLWRRYEENEAAADDAFKGKNLRVTGVIDGIDKDFMDHVIVKLRTGNQFMPVHAQLTTASARGASGLKKRSTITLACKGGTRIVGSPTLDDCWY